MRFLILSDIHANWYALETVLADAEGEYDQIVCCGDLVGYNPHPDRVTEWARDHCQALTRGNHDKVVSGLDDLSSFNKIAQDAARWTMQAMSVENLQYLKAMTKGPVEMSGFAICHGSPRDEDEYVTTASEAEECFPALSENILFFGHSHLQGGFSTKRNHVIKLSAVKKKDRENAFQLEVDRLYMVNPGSVGQPRDGDPRAAYAIYETDSRVVSLRRVAYPISKTCDDILEAGLPDVLAYRLLQGL